MGTDEFEKVSLLHSLDAFAGDLLQLLRTSLGTEHGVVDLIHLLADSRAVFGSSRLASGAVHVLESSGEHKNIARERVRATVRNVGLLAFLLCFNAVAICVAGLRGLGAAFASGIFLSSGSQHIPQRSWRDWTYEEPDWTSCDSTVMPL